MIAIVIGAYWLIGASGFLYWYSKDYDIKTPHLLLATLMGAFGPASWVVGCILHSDPNESRVWIRRRRQ